MYLPEEIMADGYIKAADSIYRKHYPPIPIDNKLFLIPDQTEYKPATVCYWQWSTTFGLWQAVVTFNNMGNFKFATYPKLTSTNKRKAG